MYPGLGLKLGGIQDPELAVHSCAVYNDWIAEWCSVAPDRLKGVGALPMQDPEEAAREAHRIRDRGLVGGVLPTRTRTTTARSTTRAYTPVWEALEETGLPLGLHIAGLPDMPGASQLDAAPHGAGDAPRADPGHRPDDDALEPRLRRRARAAPGAQGRGPRERRRLDRALDGPAQRVRGELLLGRGADDAGRRGVLPAPVLDQLRSG